MLIFFSACLMYDLAGDSVYQADSTIAPAIEPEDPVSESSPDGGINQVGMYGLSYSESEDLGQDSSIVVEVREGGIDVVHTNVDLACDMSPYEPDLHMEDQIMTIHYMPPDDERGCLMDVEFSVDAYLEEGTYTLQLMEDETEFVYE